MANSKDTPIFEGEKVILSITLFLSAAVIIAWTIGDSPLLRIVSGGATMKFNTALLFFFASISMCFFGKNHIFLIWLCRISNLFVFTFSVITLFQYLLNINLGIDNLFIYDFISTSQYPGRMSPATAVCFSLLSSAVLLRSFSPFKKISLTQIAINPVLVISLISIISYILSVPLKHRIHFFQTMAVHTSTLFFFLYVVYQLQTPSSTLSELISSKLSGSKAFKQLLTPIFFVPILLCIVLLFAISNKLINYDFGIILYTVVLITLGVGYLTIVSNNINQFHKSDITLRNDLLKTNELLNRYKLAIDQVSIVAITDQKGEIISVNDNFCSISQYSKEELIGNNHRIINSGYHSKAFFRDLWETISQGKEWVGEIKNKAKDGSYYWVHTVIVPVMMDGKPMQYVSIRRDITRHKEIDAFNAQKIERLEFKNKELEQFTYIASHDLQEPLRTLRSFANILRLDHSSQLDSDANECIQFISEASTRMSSLVKGLLDYSRLGIEPRIDRVNVKQLLTDLRADMSLVFQESGANLSFDELPEVIGLENELRALFQNLIGNSIKFSRQGIVPEIKISSFSDHDFWHFVVEDNGIGIDKNYRDKIFLLFQRLHKKHEYSGDGIGLAYCSKIVDLHGGIIWVESTVGQGSTFHFTLLKTPNYNYEKA